MTRAGRTTVGDRRNALWAGVGLVIAGSWLIFQAYEGSGVERPFLLRFLPGP